MLRQQLKQAGTCCRKVHTVVCRVLCGHLYPGECGWGRGVWVVGECGWGQGSGGVVVGE